MSCRIDGLDVVLKNVDKLKNNIVKEMNTRVAVAGMVAEDYIRQKANLTDHSYEDLQIAGFPYSKKNPANSGVHDDDSQLHIQSGKLSSNIERVDNLGSIKSTVAVGVSPSKVDYISDVLFGAPKARPRPFIQHGWLDAQGDIEDVLRGGK